jgi:hypothetical protein
VTASDILREAAAIVDGARGQTHGDRHQTFEMCAQFWSTYLGVPLTKADVCYMMALHKAARNKCGQPIRDHALDGAGYFALGGEMDGA